MTDNTELFKLIDRARNSTPTAYDPTQDIDVVLENLTHLTSPVKLVCKYCGGYPGTSVSCDHCGAPNNSLPEICGRKVEVTVKPPDLNSLHIWPFS